MVSREQRRVPLHPPVQFVPVIFGNEVEAYSFARLFHETYGVKSLVVTPYPRGPINHSHILWQAVVDRSTLEDGAKLLAYMNRLTLKFPDRRLIALVNSDQMVEDLTSRRDELDPAWFLPLPPAEAVARATSKGGMAAVYDELGLHTPPRVLVNLAEEPGEWPTELEDLRYPVVAKPERSDQLIANYGLGLRKVEEVDSVDALHARLATLREAGVRVRVVVQELIPGDDTTQWVVNGYVDSTGEVTAAGSGRVLLGLHEPNYLGNAGFILLNTENAFVADAIRILQRIGLRGAFSMDVKVDPRDGTPYWLDLNPRPGRGHYYLEVGGVNLAEAIVDDMVGSRGKLQRVSREGIFRILPTRLLNATYLRDPELLAEVQSVAGERKPVDPLAYAEDRHPLRFAYGLLHDAREARNMQTYYPHVTESGF